VQHEQGDTVGAHALPKGDLLAVGRPGRGPAAVGALGVGQLLDVGAVGVHDVDVHGAVAVGGEGNLLAVGRPAGVGVLGVAAGQVAGAFALGVDQPDFRVAGALGDDQERRLVVLLVALRGGGARQGGGGAQESEH